jgi:outer membrane protein assembly factor BamA
MSDSISVFYILLFLFLGDLNFTIAQDSLNTEKNCDDTLEIDFLISEIQISGNQKTRNNIILRELMFTKGECLNQNTLKELIEQSRTNLLKLPLFNYVSINLIPISSNTCMIDIIVEERWFLWPQMAIINNERNFNAWLNEHNLSRLDYRFSVKKYNVLGLNHIIQAGISYGFTRELSLGYQNITIDKKQKHLLGIYARTSYYNTVFYRTYANKQENFTSEQDVLTHQKLRFDYFFRPNIHIWHKLYISLQKVSTVDSLLETNPGFLAGSKTQNTFIEAMYLFILDKRDSRSYPLKGFWLDVSLIKTGLNLIDKSDVNHINISSTIKKYYQIKGRFYGAHSFTIKKSLGGFQPYYYKENLGYYDDYLRGFEYYVIEGDDYYLFKNNLKFELLPQRISYLNFIPIRKFKKIHYAFYLNAYFDLGLAHEKRPDLNLNNNLSDKILFSGGLGFDLVTYYDKVLRIEYTINNLNERGFFLHITAPI